MSHDWQATEEFPYAQDHFGNEGRQKFVCRRCGYYTFRHVAPFHDEKMCIGQPPNEVAYYSCDEIIAKRVMES